MSTNINNFRSISFPQLRTARDYHEFDTMRETLSMFGVRGVRFVEVGDASVDGQYRAVFYVGAKTNRETAELIAKINKRFNNL